MGWRVISRLDENRLASQEGLCTMELVCFVVVVVVVNTCATCFNIKKTLCFLPGIFMGRVLP